MIQAIFKVNNSIYLPIYGHFQFKLEKKFPQGAKKKSTLALKLYMIFSVRNTLNYMGKMLELT